MPNFPSADSAVILALAEGVDPLTGEVLPSDHLLQNPQIVRALFRASRALEDRDKAARRSASAPERAGEPWTDEEDADLLSACDSKVFSCRNRKTAWSQSWSHHIPAYATWKGY